MAPKKPASKKRVYKRKTTMTKPRSMVPVDGTNLLCTSYFEIGKLQPLGGSAGKLSYSIKIAPQGLVITTSEGAVATSETVGLFINKGDNASIVLPGATSGTIPLTRFAEFASNGLGGVDARGIYNQYRINSCKLSVIVDRDCGLENPICFSASKNSSAPHSDMGTIVGGAHKQYTMTETRRTANYGWVAKESADKDFRMSSATLADADAWSMKVFQEVDKKDHGLCKHRVSISLNLTLKDSSKN